MTTQRATLIGSTTILMWSALALLTVLAGEIPPLQMTAISFTLATVMGVVMLQRSADGWQTLRQVPKRVWLLGVYGLFGYHLFYFIALGNAPVVEANLLNYLWPLLMVLFSALLPDEPLRWFHLVGVGLGFAGAGLLVLGLDGGLEIAADYWWGYTAALICAFIWSSYSVASRQVGLIPTTAVGGFCAATAVLAWVAHLLFETFVMPQGIQWVALFLLGLGPVGGAFFTWDVGMKRGNIKLLGTLAYAAPLFSTLLLIGVGLADLTWRVAVACVLIICAAVVSSGQARPRPWRRMGIRSEK